MKLAILLHKYSLFPLPLQLLLNLCGILSTWKFNVGADPDSILFPFYLLSPRNSCFNYKLHAGASVSRPNLLSTGFKYSVAYSPFPWSSPYIQTKEPGPAAKFHSLVNASRWLSHNHRSNLWFANSPLSISFTNTSS